MKKLYKCFHYILMVVTILTISCVTDKNKLHVTRKLKNSIGSKTSNIDTKVVVVSINHNNDQLIINGENLIGTTDVTLDSQALTIITVSATQLVLSAASNVAITFGGVMNLIITNAAGAAPVSVTFSAVNDSILSAHIADFQVGTGELATDAVTNIKVLNNSLGGEKLSQMGASDGQSLKWNNGLSKWEPGIAGGLTYLGTWNANTNAEGIANDGAASGSGNYYIVNVAGTQGAIAAGINFNIGDWLISDGTNWQKITNTSGITSMDSLSNVETAGAALGDIIKYNTGSSKWEKGTLALGDMSDTDLMGFNPSDVLYFNNGTSKWEPVDVNTLVTGVANAQINDLAAIKLTGALPAIDGSALTNLPAQSDATKLPLTGGALSGDLSMGVNNIIISGTVDGVDVSTLSTTVSTNATNITTNTTAIIGREASLPGGGTAAKYLDGTKSWVDFETSVLGVVLAGYSTAVSFSAIVVGDTITGALGKLEYKIDNAPSGTGDFLADGSVAMTGAINMGSQDLTASGNIDLSLNKTLGLGRLTTAQEATYTAGTPVVGRTWYNTTTNKVMYWDGSLKELGVAGAGITSFGGETGSAHTLATGTSGTAPAFSSAANTHTLNIPLAATGGTTAGLLSKTDYDNFDGKQDALPTGGTTLEYIRGDLTKATLDSSVVPENTNLYFTDARAKTAAFSDAIADAEVTLAPTQNAVFDALALKQDIITNPVTGTGTDNRVALFSGAGSIDASSVTDVELAYVSGVTSGIQTQIDNLSTADGSYLKHDGSQDLTGNLLFKKFASIYEETGAGTNAVTIKAPAALGVDYNLILPIDAGTNNQVLKTDGSGNLSWANDADTVDTNTQNSESTVEGFIANDVTTGYIPYGNGTKLVDSNIFDNGTNIGIGTASPDSTLTVEGAIRSKASTLNATSTIDFITGNLQHTTLNCQAFALHNLKDGGSYTFAVQGTVSTTCSFTAFSDSGSTSLTVHMPTDHAGTTTSTHTLYSILAMGTHIYIAWMPDL